MSSPERLSFREKAGSYALWGGIIAGLIGLIANSELLAAGIGIAGAGYILKKLGKNS